MRIRGDIAEKLQRGIDWAVFGTGAFALSTAILATAFLHLTDGTDRNAPLELAQVQID